MSDEELPSGWCWASVYQIGDVCAGVGFPERLQGRTTGDVPVFKVGDISRAWQSGDPVLRRAEHYVSNAEAKSLGRLLPQHTTVFAKIGAAIGLNRRSLLAQASLVDNNVFGVVPGAAVDPRFLFHFFCTIRFIEDSRATTVPSLRKDDVGGKAIPLPPLAEQDRVVAALDSYLSRLDDAIANLERARRNLGRYRASVLQAAVEGRLVPTEAALARADGRAYEPADALLARTPAPPRPNRYNSRSTDTVRGHAALAIGNPGHKLPEGWAWASLVDVARLESGHTPSREHPEWWDGDVPWIGIADAREHDGGVIRTTFQTTNPAGLANSAARLLPAETVCLSRTASVGYVVVMGLPMATSQDFVNWTCTPAVMPHWLRLVLQTDREVLRRFGKGSVHKTIYFPEVLALAIAVPPVAEQARIIAEVDRLLSVTATTGATISAQLVRVKRLRQSVLKWAFEGKLVDQDPADEPAAVLLERIRAGRDGTTAQTARAANKRQRKGLGVITETP